MILEYFKGPHYELSQYSAYVKGLLVECQLEGAEFSVFNNTLSCFQWNKHKMCYTSLGASSKVTEIGTKPFIPKFYLITEFFHKCPTNVDLKCVIYKGDI